MKNLFSTFIEDGYVLIRDAINLKLIDKTVEAFFKFKKANYEQLNSNTLFRDGMLQRVVNLQICIPSLKDIFVDAMNKSESIVDRNGKATLYTSLFFEKSSEQSLHIDTPYFFSGNELGFMGCWVALENSDESNGTLKIIKGSHKLTEPNLNDLSSKYFKKKELIPSSYTPLFNDFNNKLVQTAENKGLETSVIDLKKGDLLIWHPSTLHGAVPHKNLSKTRLSYVMHVTPKNMPMMHMDYFFNRDKKIPKVKRNYTEHKDRLINEATMIDFLHMKTFNRDDLGVFE